MKKVLFLALLLILFAGCSSKTPGSKEITADDVISPFNDAGLDAENTKEITKNDDGLVPMKAENAKHITLTSVCDDLWTSSLKMTRI